MKDFFFVIFMIALTLWGIFNFGVLEYKYVTSKAGYENRKRRYEKGEFIHCKECQMSPKEYTEYILFSNKKGEEFYYYVRNIFLITTVLSMGLNIILYIKYRKCNKAKSTQKST